MKATTDSPVIFKALFWLNFSSFWLTFFSVIVTNVLVLSWVQFFQFKSTDAVLLFSCFYSFFWLMTIVGGYLGDRYCNRCLIWVGYLFTLVGLFLVMLHCFYVGLAAYVLGMAYIRPNIRVLIGKLCPSSLSKRDAYWHNYIYMNAGALTSGFGAGYLLYSLHFELTILFSILGSSLLLLTYIQADRALVSINLRKAFHFSAQLREGLALTGLGIVLTFILAVLLSFYHWVNNALVWGGLLFILIWGGVIVRKQTPERPWLILFWFFSSATVIFWALFYFEPTVLLLFISEYVHQYIWGLFVPAPSFVGLNCLGNLMVLWLIIPAIRWLAKKCQWHGSPSHLLQCLVGLVILCVAGLMLYHYSFMVSPTQLLSPWLMALIIFLVAAAEVFISPVSSAIVFEFVPAKQQAFYVGYLYFCTGLGIAITGMLVSSVTGNLPTEKKSLALPLELFQYSYKWYVYGALFTLLLVLALWWVQRLLKPLSK